MSAQLYSVYHCTDALVLNRMTGGTEVRNHTKGFGNSVFIGLTAGLDDLTLPPSSSDAEVEEAAASDSHDASDVEINDNNSPPSPPASAFPRDEEDQPPLFHEDPQSPSFSSAGGGDHNDDTRSKDWRPQSPPWAGAADADAEMNDWGSKRKSSATADSTTVCHYLFCLPGFGTSLTFCSVIASRDG